MYRLFCHIVKDLYFLSLIPSCVLSPLMRNTSYISLHEGEAVTTDGERLHSNEVIVWKKVTTNRRIIK